MLISDDLPQLLQNPLCVSGADLNNFSVGWKDGVNGGVIYEVETVVPWETREPVNFRHFVHWQVAFRCSLISVV
jgi:hypothetical protein